MNFNVVRFVLDIFNDFKVFQISDEAKVRLLSAILVSLRFKVSKFHAPANSATSAGLFCPARLNNFKPGQLSIVTLTKELIELF